VCEVEKHQSSEVSSWVAYHIEAARAAQIQIYAYLIAQRRSKIPTDVDPQKLLEMTPEEFYTTIPKKILNIYPDLEMFMKYMICMNRHLVKAAGFIPDTSQVRRETNKAKRDTISLAREYWTPQTECKRPAEYGGFKTAKECRNAGEEQKDTKNDMN